MQAINERTLVIIKPDAVARGLVGEIISRFERKGLRIERMIHYPVLPLEVLQKQYAEHFGKPFYEGLIAMMREGPAVTMQLSGYHAIAVCRKLIGATAGHTAEPGTIRGDFGLSQRMNLIHASDSIKSAESELILWFGVQYDNVVGNKVKDPLIYSPVELAAQL